MAVTLENQGDGKVKGFYLSEKMNPIIFPPDYGKYERIIPTEEVAATAWYEDLAKLSIIFNHDIVERHEGGKMEDGSPRPIWRWKKNLFTSWLCGHGPFYTPSSISTSANFMAPAYEKTITHRGSLDLNCLAIDLHNGVFTMEEWMKFYMQIGYSLDGFCEVFGQHEASEFDLPGALPLASNENYTETIIDYMNRIHEGKILKL